MEVIADKLVQKMVDYEVIKPSQKSYHVYGAILVLTSFFITLLMLVSAIVTPTPLAAVAYISAYWLIHSSGDSYHCKRYFHCFFLSMGVYAGMLFLNILMSTQVLNILTLLLIISTLAILFVRGFGHLAAVSNGRRLLVVNAISTLIAIITFASGFIGWAFPFSYGMYVINIMQEKVRTKE